MNNLKHIYLKMIYESIGFLKFNMESYHNFLKNSIKFKNRKVIVKDKNLLIDIPEEFINYCIDHKESLINFNTIKTLMKSSKHYQNIKNIISSDKLYFSIFDFDNDNEITEFHLKLFKNLSSDDLSTINEEFKNNCRNLDGFLNMNCFDSIVICVINSNCRNKYETIYHELSHFIQKICNIRITSSTIFNKEENNSNNRFNKLKNLGISYEDLKYYFSEKEYSTHVDELINGLWKTYLKFYKNEFSNILFFLVMVRNEIKNEKDFSKSILLKHYAEANNNDISPLTMFVAAFYLNHKYQKIDKAIQFHLCKIQNV